MKIRKHIGINQKTGKLKKGYRYSGRRLKNGSAEIVRVLVGGGKASTKKKGKRKKYIDGEILTGIKNYEQAILENRRFDIQNYFKYLLKKGFTPDESRYIFARVSKDGSDQANAVLKLRESQRKRNEKDHWIEKHAMRWTPHRG